MERIQEALAKARAQRQQGSATRTQHAAHAPAPANRSRRPGRRWRPSSSTAPHLKRYRVVAAEGGRDAAPYDLCAPRSSIRPDPTAGGGWRSSRPIWGPARRPPRQSRLQLRAAARHARAVPRSRPAPPHAAQGPGQKPDHSMADVLERRVRFAEHGLRLGERVGFGLNNGPAPNPSELLLSRAARDALDGVERDYAPDLTSSTSRRSMPATTTSPFCRMSIAR